MTINTDVNVELDSDQVDAYIWNEMDAFQQAELLTWMGRRHALYKHDVERQMCSVKEQFDLCFNEHTRGNTIEFLESLLGWLKGDSDG